MNSSFVLSPEAFDDLKHIQDYISLDNPDIASRIINEIFDVLYMLENNPCIGHKRADLTDKSVLFWSIYSYMIVYSIKDNSIEIVRVLSAYRDLARILQ